MVVELFVWQKVDIVIGRKLILLREQNYILLYK